MISNVKTKSICNQNEQIKRKTRIKRKKMTKREDKERDVGKTIKHQYPSFVQTPIIHLI